MKSALGLAGFAAYASVCDDCRRWVALVVLVNGIVYHTAVAARSCRTPAFFAWDVLCNACLVAWTNATSRCQPWTVVATLVALSAWILEHSLVALSEWSHVVHVVGVQLVLLAALVTAFAGPVVRIRAT
jgi:hypothetical protein